MEEVPSSLDDVLVAILQTACCVEPSVTFVGLASLCRAAYVARLGEEQKERVATVLNDSVIAEHLWAMKSTVQQDDNGFFRLANLKTPFMAAKQDLMVLQDAICRNLDLFAYMEWQGTTLDDLCQRINRSTESRCDREVVMLLLRRLEDKGMVEVRRASAEDYRTGEELWCLTDRCTALFGTFDEKKKKKKLVGK
jgi:hypothetical protein